jgi:hypothetical protein
MTTDSDSHVLRRQQALQRLEASRLKLRAQLLDLPEGGAEADGGHAHGMPRRLRVLWRALRRRLRAWPMAGVALAAVQGWWRKHPLRGGGELLAYELNTSLLPAVRRHPERALLIGATAGFGLVLLRPWRWPLVAGQLKPLPGRLGHWLLAQLSQAPLQALLSAALGVMAGRAAAAGADGSTAQTSPPPG